MCSKHLGKIVVEIFERMWGTNLYELIKLTSSSSWVCRKHIVSWRLQSWGAKWLSFGTKVMRVTLGASPERPSGQSTLCLHPFIRRDLRRQALKVAEPPSWKKSGSLNHSSRVTHQRSTIVRFSEWETIFYCWTIEILRSHLPQKLISP